MKIWCSLSDDGTHDFEEGYQIPDAAGLMKDAYVCECGWRVLVSEVPDYNALMDRQRAAKRSTVS